MLLQKAGWQNKAERRFLEPSEREKKVKREGENKTNASRAGLMTPFWACAIVHGSVQNP